MGGVSVVIPTYNRLERVTAAIESVRRQSVCCAEIIVVDDGSTDGSFEALSERFKDIQILRQQNAGVSAARNVGIRAAAGEWIALLDSDDEWLPNKVRAQLAVLNDNPGLLLCHTEEIWIRHGKRVNPMRKHAKHGGWIYDKCLPLCAISPSSAMIHRSVFDEIGFFDESLPACEDYDFWLRFCARRPVLFVEEPLLVKYGGHDDQLSKRFWGMDRFRIQALEKVLESGSLSPADALATRETLLTKLGVYIGGARRRGRDQEAAVYQTKQQRWAADQGYL